DLNLRNVLGTGNQCEGFYYYNSQGDLVHLDLWGPYKVTSSEGFKYFLTVMDDYTRAVWVYLIKSKDEDSVTGKNDTSNVFQDINHVNFFDIKYPEIPYDDERVDPNLNSDRKSQSDSSHSSVSGRDVNTADFSNNSWNDADSSEDIFATQNEKIIKMDALLRNDTWDIVDLPKDRKAIGKGIDYAETFSLVVKVVTIRCLLNIAVSNSWPVFQLDVNNAFLYGDLAEIVYMKPLEGQSKYDYSLYTKSDKDVFLALLVYVDDIILTGNNVFEIDKYKVFLKSKFMIKDLGKLKYFLASVNDPILDNITDYQKLMRKIIYLTNTRPDISYDVHCLSPFMHSPLKSHLKIAFKILRYLKSCPGLGIHIIKNSSMSLSDFSDVDSAKCVVTRKSVTGYCVFLNDSLVSWKSKKQNTLSKSSTKAEYRALALVTSEVVWIFKFLKDLKCEVFFAFISSL
ncbi:ribonuclease H-like domain-containing protein, partial [Tanacetum coccineum]